jgi:hypothetical protein
MQRLSVWLALRCKEPLFQEFLQVSSEPEAVKKVRELCKVTSRSHIDFSPEAKELFHSLIRIPYLEFSNKRES